MSGRFNGKVAIVTGAGEGIGFEICKRLAAEGAIVFLNDIDPVRCHQAVEKIITTQGVCIGFPGDAADVEFARSVTVEAKEKFGKVDLIVANAGLTLFGPFLTFSPSDLSRILAVNIQGPFLLAQAAARIMKGQHAGGRIVFTSSVTGHQAHKNLVAYGMTKAAIEMLAKGLVAELSEYSIAVNAVAPGATLTERTQSDPLYAETWSHLTPLKRPASTEDIAHAVLFLLADEARHITGQSLLIDGGWSSISPSPFQEE